MAVLTLVNTCILLLLCLLMITVNNGEAETKKKDLKGTPSFDTAPRIDLPGSDINQLIRVTMRTLGNDENKVINNKSASHTDRADYNMGEHLQIPQDLTMVPKEHWINVAEETKFNLKEPHFDYDDDDMPESFKTGFYIFLGLSTAALLLIVVKVYRLRLSRAERKYGVQGNRSTQELTPLPVSVENGNSDDEDQTLFEVNQHNIRIL